MVDEFNPKLTIVVPVALMSGRLQNLEKWVSKISHEIKVLLMHDIKDTKTGPELEALVARFKSKNIQLIQKRFGSTGAARNAGLELTNSRWVGFWDSDDLPILPSYLEMIDSAEKKYSDIAIGGFTKVDDRSLNIVGKQKFGASKQENLSLICANPGIWRFAFKTVALKDIRFPNLRIGEEQVFIEMLNLVTAKVYFSQKEVYEYFVGSFHHTSKKKKAIADITKAMRISWELINLDRSENVNYKINFFVRQALSATKNGNSKTKLKGFIYLLWKTVFTDNAKRKLIIQNLYTIIYS